MSRIVATVDVRNFIEPSKTAKIDALVDTDTRYLTLPTAWKDRFGTFDSENEVALQTATQETVTGTVCGPVSITIEGFRSIFSEILFVDMTPSEGEYEPLLGSIALEQCGAAVDMLGHRLVPVEYMDAK